MASCIFSQVDGEGDDVATGRYWPSGHVNGVLNVSFVQSKNIKMFQSLQHEIFHEFKESCYC